MVKALGCPVDLSPKHHSTIMSFQHTIPDIDYRKGAIYRGAMRQDLQAEVHRLLNSQRMSKPPT